MPSARLRGPARAVSFARWLAVSRPHLPPFLVGGEAWLRLERQARGVPADCAGALEVRLGTAGGAVDLSLRLARPSQARRMAERVAPPHLRSFLLDWAHRSELRAAVPAVWLEFDLDEEPAADARQVPGVCAQLAPGYDQLWLEERLLPALHGQPLAAAQRRTVRRCCEQIPNGARLLYAFSMLSRRTGCVRLELLALGAWPLAEYLERVAPAIARQVVALSRLGDGAERTHLSLDVGGGGEVSPRVGLEWSFARRPGREPRWADLFDRLAARGLCRDEKRRAVLAWPGADSFWRAPREWPVEGGGIGGICRRTLSHVKLVHLPGREPEAKAYLLLSHQPAAGSPIPSPARAAAALAAGGGTPISRARRATRSS